MKKYGKAIVLTRRLSVTKILDLNYQKYNGWLNML